MRSRAEVVEGLGPQPAGDVAHVLETRACLFAGLGELGLHLPVDESRQPVDLQHDRGQALPDLVVQLTGNAPAL